MLLSAEGVKKAEIAELTGASRVKVGRWRRRHAERGLGLEDAKRPGRPRSLDHVALGKTWRRRRRLNKPIDYASTADGRRRRVYGQPATPLDRLVAANVLSPAQQAGLRTYRDSLNPAAIGREIADLQAVPPTDPLLRGHSYMRHGQSFAGNLT